MNAWGTPRHPVAAVYLADMPSYDTNGKRLSGSAQRKLKAAKRGVAKTTTPPTALTHPRPGPDSPPVPVLFLGHPAPPTASVEAVECWAAGLNLRGAEGILNADEEEAPRFFAVTTIVREMGKLKRKALRAEEVLKLRRLRLGGEGVDLNTPPYDDPPAQLVYVFHRLATLAHKAATDPAWTPDPRILVGVKALAQQGYVACDSELERIVSAIEEE